MPLGGSSKEVHVSLHQHRSSAGCRADTIATTMSDCVKFGECGKIQHVNIIKPYGTV